MDSNATEGALEVREHPSCMGMPVTWTRFARQRQAREICIPYATVAVILSGQGHRRLSFASRHLELATSPGMIAVSSGNLEIKKASYEGSSGELVAIQFPEHALARLRGDDSRLMLRAHFDASDDRIAWLVTSIWRDMASPESNSLYSEGLLLALVSVLRQRFGLIADGAGKPLGRFKSSTYKRLVEFIEQELGESLTIERLAMEVGLSPQHFSRVFRNTFDQSPHAYVMQRRIDAARRSLRNDQDRLVSDIALEVGFSSPAHFAKCFKDLVGISPALWRRC